MNLENCLYIIEDNPRDSDFLAGLLSDFAIVKLGSGQEAIESLPDHSGLHIISDIQMPEMDGISMAKQIWEHRPDARILFWTQFDDEMYVRSLANIIPSETVYGYILKNNRADVILKAVNAVFSEDQCWIDPKVRPVQARLRNNNEALTDIEYEALIDIAIGLTDNAIARRRYLSRRGVQNRLKSLYLKLSVDISPAEDGINGDIVNPRARAISIAFRRGLINAFILDEEEKTLSTWLKVL
ncbi:MAG: response regulator transcription factor [Gammaproteobacteria bacterium]|nr:response regulator transcription factor [Gammaproteobacteria bacterium]